MKIFITQISIVLLLVVALPVAFIFVKQISNLSENEEIVQRVFDQQLETILFTINQNSENIINSWISQIDLQVDSKGELMKNITQNIFQNNSAVFQISFYNVKNQQQPIVTFFNESLAIIDTPSSGMVDKLNEYLKNKYQRVESVRKNEFTFLYFILKSGNQETLGAITIHSKTFVDQNLRPGIQQISQDRFIISVSDTLQQNLISHLDTATIENSNIHRQELWYVPGFFMNIKLQSATIDELVKARSKRDDYLFFGLIIIVLLGVTFVIISIRKEVKLAEMKSEFVSNVSHEIRTPLALISMYAETLLLKRVKTEGKNNEYLKVIYLETSRLTSLVNRILSFSKIESKKRTYQFTEVDVNSAVNEVVEIFQPHLISNNVECNLNLSDDVLYIHADKESVMESLINLVDNAIKYGRKHNKKIEIRTFIDHQSLVIEVEDNGIGIASKHHKQIFDKFYRVTQGNLALKAKGSGLGLNIVQQIMDIHGGKIIVKSKEGKGSCFSLVFST